MIDRSTIDRIRAAADIVDVVGEFVSLRRSGTNYKGLCPFHDEKTPSFMVSPSKQICKCFSCGKGGDIFRFVMEHEQMTYPEAIKWLGRKYGIEVRDREVPDEERERETARESMFVLNDWARNYFEQALHATVDGRAVGMAYFRKRGLRDDIIGKFHLGYSPERRDALACEAKEKGFNEKFLEATGLCYRTDDGKLLDRYHGRVIFPVFTVSGRVVAFGGRVLGNEKKNVGKYVNSPESEIYHKQNELYGLYQAKSAISKNDRCYLVEGYLDVISMFQSGIENVVASSGTSLTTGQIRLIHRFTNNVTVLYDGDAAGIHASIRGIDMLLSEGLNIKVLLLPNGEDPDSFAQHHSAQDFRQYIEDHQVDFIQFKTDLLMADAAGDPIKRSRVVQDIVRSIAVIPDLIVRQTYVHECASRVNMPEATIANAVTEARQKIKAERRQPAQADVPGVVRPEDVPAQGHPVAESPLRMAVPELREERLLASIVVRYGSRMLYPLPEEGTEAPADDEFNLPVATFVQEELQTDGLELQSDLYRQIINEAAEHAGEPEFKTLYYFLSHPNAAISAFAAEVAEDKYVLCETQRQLYVPDEKRLFELVPRVILDYKHAVVAAEKRNLLQQLRNPEVSSDAAKCGQVMRRLLELQAIDRALGQMLGDRVIEA